MTTPLGLYLHVPFCEIKCGYCDFYSLTGSPEEAREAFTTTLCGEIRMKATHGPADTIFLGGGTPSLLTPDQIGRILQALRESFALAPDAEITMEANPETVTAASLAGFRSAGVNRLSFGVQSLEPGILKTLGRIHSAQRARDAVQEARRAGFERLNADLIFGLPGQSPEIWRRDLTEVLSWPVDHVSCYELTIEPGTAFGARPPKLPEEEATMDMWKTVMTETATAGFGHYEVSNYARAGAECRHNLKYWLDTDFFGFGPAAWGSLQGIRYGNPPSLKRWMDGRERNFPPAQTDALPLLARQAETLVLNLRLRSGCDEAAFAARYGRPALDRFLPTLWPHIQSGRVERKDGRLRLTDAGLLVGNSVWGDIYSAA